LAIERPNVASLPSDEIRKIDCSLLIRCSNARSRRPATACRSQITYIRIRLRLRIRLRGSREIRIPAVWPAWHAMRYVKKRAVNYEDNSESCVCVPHITSFRLREFLHASQSALNPLPDRCTLPARLGVPTIASHRYDRYRADRFKQGDGSSAVRKKRALRRESDGRSEEDPKSGIETNWSHRSDYRLFRKLKTRAASFDRVD